MLLDQRFTKASLTRSQLARGFTVAGRPIGQRWYEDPAKGGDPPADPATPETDERDKDLDTIEGLGDKGKTAIRKERDARAESERKLSDAARRLQDLERKETDRAEAQRKVDEKAAAEAGKFEELATKREQERDAATADVTRLTTENAALKAAVNAILDVEWKELPKEIKELYLGDEGDPLARLTFLPKAKVAATQHEAAKGNGANPPPAGGQRPSVEQTTQEMRQLRGFRPRLVRSG